MTCNRSLASPRLEPTTAQIPLGVLSSKCVRGIIGIHRPRLPNQRRRRNTSSTPPNNKIKKYRCTTAPRHLYQICTTLELLTSRLHLSFVLPCPMTKQKNSQPRSGFPRNRKFPEPPDSLFGKQSRPRRRSLERHSRRCIVCNHPDRETIEQAFLNWQSPEKIAREYGIANHASIYRHAHAMKLFSRRCAHYRSELENIIEQAGSTKYVTGKDILNAIFAVARLNGDGSWVNPPRKCTYIKDSAPESASEPSSTGPNPDPSPATAIPENLNSKLGRFRHDATL